MGAWWVRERDGSASNDSSNMMETVRHALLLGRLRYGAEAVTHLDVLRRQPPVRAQCSDVATSERLRWGCRPTSGFFFSMSSFSGAGDPIAALAQSGAHRRTAS